MGCCVRTGDSAADFWSANADILLGHESENNLMVGLTLRLLSAERTVRAHRFFTIRRGGAIVGQAIHTGGQDALICARMPADAAEALAEACHRSGAAPVRVRGPSATAERFARALATLQGSGVRLVQRQGLYELRSVRWPSHNGGTLLPATQEHRPLVLAWMEGFIRECFPEVSDPRAVAEGIVERRLQAGHLFLWADAGGVPVAVAGRNREGPTTATISLVYTPPDRRRQGHARAVVAHLSQHWLDKGKSACNLFTNLENPASNRAYISVGYTLLQEQHIYAVG